MFSPIGCNADPPEHTLYVPLAIHRLQTDEGNGGVTRIHIDRMIKKLNTAFSDVKIEFYLYELDDIKNTQAYYDDDLGYDETYDLLTMTDDFSKSPPLVEGAINLVVANYLFADDGDGKNENGWFDDDNEFDYLALEKGTGTFVWPHEMGHLFGLDHTKEDGTYMSAYDPDIPAKFTRGQNDEESDQVQIMWNKLAQRSFRDEFFLISEEKPNPLPDTNFISVGCGDDYDSLDKAIRDISNDGTIEICEGTYEGNWSLKSINATIQAAEGHQVILKAKENSPTLTLSNSTSTLRNLTITDGMGAEDSSISDESPQSDGSGGNLAINDGSQVTLETVIIKDGFAGFGGGISVSENSTLDANGLTLVNNAASYGGGISCQDNSKLALTKTNFLLNQSFDLASALYMASCEATFTDVDFNLNVSDGMAALAASSSSITGSNVEFYWNKSNTSPSDIYLLSSGMMLTDSSFSNNEACEEDNMAVIYMADMALGVSDLILDNVTKWEGNRFISMAKRDSSPIGVCDIEDITDYLPSLSCSTETMDCTAEEASK